MSSRGFGQTGLSDYSISVPEQATTSTSSDREPKLGFESPPEARSLPDEYASAREADWVAFTGRYPFVFDAARLGFAIGHREDLAYNWTPEEVSLPVHFLDNDYESADLSRFTRRVFHLEPELAVLGDIYKPEDLHEHEMAAAEIWGSFPEMELMLVPKYEGALEDIPSKFVLGYANGASPVQATDIASHEEWRTVDNRLHILGGTPLSTLEEINALTEPWVTGEPPAEIAGLDWNGYHLYAEAHGDYAAADGGWHRNLREDFLPTRDLIRYSLLNGKHFWSAHGIWPAGDPSSLQPREQLLKAARGGPVASNIYGDARELFISPSRSSHHQQSPILRTDDTQAELIEPLSPLASLLGSTSWTPDGAFDGEATYDPPKAHRTDFTCVGCGSHILADDTGHHSDGPGTTMQLVSYEHQHTEDTHHYSSVPRHGPKRLEGGRLYPRIYAYCSDTCRCRAESQSPRLLLDASEALCAVPDGDILARIDCSPA